MNTDRITDYDQIPLYLDVSELARTMGISKSASYELMRTEGFPVSVIAGKKMVQKDKLLDWIVHQENQQVEGFRRN